MLRKANGEKDTESSGVSEKPRVDLSVIAMCHFLLIGTLHFKRAQYYFLKGKSSTPFQVNGVQGSRSSQSVHSVAGNGIPLPPTTKLVTSDASSIKSSFHSPKITICKQPAVHLQHSKCPSTGLLALIW